MDASTAIVWVCVGIFAATAIVYFLYLFHVPIKLPAAQARQLFKALILETVTVSLGLFSYYAYNSTHRPGGGLPQKQLMLIEDGQPTGVRDDDRTLWVRAADVKLCYRKKIPGPAPNCIIEDPCDRQYVSLRLSFASDMSNATSVDLDASTTMTVKVSDKQSAARSYAVSASDFGNLAKQLTTAHAQEHDFVMLSIDRATQ